MCELQWHKTHCTLDLLRFTRVEGVEIGTCNSFYSRKFPCVTKQAIKAEQGTADSRLLPVEQYCAPIVQHNRIAPVHVGVIQRRRDICQRISIELERRLRITQPLNPFCGLVR